MRIVKWAAVAVTALFALMNLGAGLQTDLGTGYRILGGVLAALGVAAAVGLAANQFWGRAAVIAVGSLNVIIAVTGLFTHQDGAAIGIVVGGLGAVLGALTSSGAKRPATV